MICVRLLPMLRPASLSCPGHYFTMRLAGGMGGGHTACTSTQSTPRTSDPTSARSSPSRHPPTHESSARRRCATPPPATAASPSSPPCGDGRGGAPAPRPPPALSWPLVWSAPARSLCAHNGDGTAAAPGGGARRPQRPVRARGGRAPQPLPYKGRRQAVRAVHAGRARRAARPAGGGALGGAVSVPGVRAGAIARAAGGPKGRGWGALSGACQPVRLCVCFGGGGERGAGEAAAYPRGLQRGLQRQQIGSTPTPLSLHTRLAHSPTPPCSLLACCPISPAHPPHPMPPPPGYVAPPLAFERSNARRMPRWAPARPAGPHRTARCTCWAARIPAAAVRPARGGPCAASCRSQPQMPS